jgi:hypothetical protein
MLLLASLACLSGGGEADSGDDGQSDFEATQRSLESTQNALDVQQENPDQAPTQAAQEQPDNDSPPPEAPSGAPFSLQSAIYSHPSGIFDTYPPVGWEASEDTGATLFSAPDGSGAVYYQVTNTGTELIGDAFVSFINARELNFFGGFDGYSELDREIDAAEGLGGVTKDLLFDGVSQRVYTFYDRHGQTIYSLDFWADTDVYDSYMNVYEQMLNGTTVYSDTAARQDPFLWIYDFYGPADLFTMEVPIGFEYYRSQEYDYTIVDSFYAPDGNMVIENVAYDDGEAISKSVAGQFALGLLHEFYADDIKITGDKVQPDGSERLTWYSPGGGYTGISFFESRGTTFLLLSLWWDDDYEDIYVPVVDNAINTYTVP